VEDECTAKKKGSKQDSLDEGEREVTQEKHIRVVSKRISQSPQGGNKNQKGSHRGRETEKLASLVLNGLDQ